MHTTRARIASATAAVALTATGSVFVAAPAEAKADSSCLKAGMATLRGAGLVSTVARDGLPIATAVSLGVAPRAGTDLSAVPDPLPLSVVLRDHLAGDASLFVYPWCD
ncbi:hypothetical protein [Nocardioides sp. Soil805]|uniref:hypothetical protein n=1 Tax=Nocardioides sp. Soil805 TaxID=1736416 RepID=UPI000702ADA1|nr:hypothetical protein [Nocardioides sp. Soil805]KRF36768.1 hypothetical protein ASG94_04975 [Nocardioides sp. Soil805]